jgi:thiamine phosphate synthase YjbQ (UPF0047 family)
MKFLTDYLWFNTPRHRDYVNITDRVEEAVRKSGVTEGMVLVSAMHITAAVMFVMNLARLLRDFFVPVFLRLKIAFFRLFFDVKEQNRVSCAFVS